MNKYKKILFVTRRRNEITNSLLNNNASADINFDYRGKSFLLLLLKAWITSTEITQPDICLYEGAMCAYLSFFKSKNAKHILYANGPDFSLARRKGLVAKLKIMLLKILLSRISKVIAISKMVAEDCEKVLGKKIEIKTIPISNDFIDILLKKNGQSIEYNLEEPYKFIFGADRPHETGFTKGLDLAILQFNEVYKKFPNSSLTLIGKGTENLIFNNPNIKGTGRININQIRDYGNIILATSRYDALNMLVIEGLLKGCVVYTSKNVGAASSINGLENHIIDLDDPQSLLKSILQFNEYGLKYLRLDDIKNYSLENMHESFTNELFN